MADIEDLIDKTKLTFTKNLQKLHVFGIISIFLSIFTMIYMMNSKTQFKILVVEDNDTLREGMVRVVKKLGHEPRKPPTQNKL